ncbi:hypothetical protein E4U58_000634 [Claviceps cyperi]|nr:hypothetical protein E4U58_000634 [Claviceps cyperi]
MKEGNCVEPREGGQVGSAGSEGKQVKQFGSQLATTHQSGARLNSVNTDRSPQQRSDLRAKA